MQAADLDQLITRFPECIIAAYADITTGVVYLTSGGTKAPREALNELCAEAALTIGLPDAPALGADLCPVAIKLVDHALFVYARAGDDPGDALLFMCRTEIEIQPFLDAVAYLAIGGAA